MFKIRFIKINKHSFMKKKLDNQKKIPWIKNGYPMNSQINQI